MITHIPARETGAWTMRTGPVSAPVMRHYGRRLRAHAPWFVRFGLVGGLGAALNMAILYGLVREGHWPHLVAALVATEMTILSNFVLNDRWAFRSLPASIPWMSRVLRYQGIALAGATLSLGVLALLTVGAHVHYLVANLGGIGAGTLWNYALNARLTWTMTRLGAHLDHVALQMPTEYPAVRRADASGCRPRSPKRPMVER